METIWKTFIWSQFGAAIDMLENAIRACPDELWSERSKSPEWAERNVVGFWYVAYHTLFFLDLYLSGSAEGFKPPAPFTLDELDPAGLLPERAYTKVEIQSYLDHARNKLRLAIAGMTNMELLQPAGFEWLNLSKAELLLYNMRHVQHHAAQLNLILRQTAGSAPRWVAKAGNLTALFRRIGQHSNVIIANLDKSAGDLKTLRLAGRSH